MKLLSYLYVCGVLTWARTTSPLFRESKKTDGTHQSRYDVLSSADTDTKRHRTNKIPLEALMSAGTTTERIIGISSFTEPVIFGHIPLPLYQSLSTTSPSRIKKTLKKREARNISQRSNQSAVTVGGTSSLQDLGSPGPPVPHSHPRYNSFANNDARPTPSPVQATFFRQHINQLAPEIRTRLRNIYKQTGFTSFFQNLLMDALANRGRQTQQVDRNMKDDWSSSQGTPTSSSIQTNKAIGQVSSMRNDVINGRRSSEAERRSRTGQTIFRSTNNVLQGRQSPVKFENTPTSSTVSSVNADNLPTNEIKSNLLDSISRHSGAGRNFFLHDNTSRVVVDQGIMLSHADLNSTRIPGISGLREAHGQQLTLQDWTLNKNSPTNKHHRLNPQTQESLTNKQIYSQQQPQTQESLTNKQIYSQQQPQTQESLTNKQIYSQQQPQTQESLTNKQIHPQQPQRRQSPSSLQEHQQYMNNMRTFHNFQQQDREHSQQELLKQQQRHMDTTHQQVNLRPQLQRQQQRLPGLSNLHQQSNFRQLQQQQQRIYDLNNPHYQSNFRQQLQQPIQHQSPSRQQHLQQQQQQRISGNNWRNRYQHQSVTQHIPNTDTQQRNNQQSLFTRTPSDMNRYQSNNVVTNFPIWPGFTTTPWAAIKSGQISSEDQPEVVKIYRAHEVVPSSESTGLPQQTTGNDLRYPSLTQPLQPSHAHVHETLMNVKISQSTLTPLISATSLLTITSATSRLTTTTSRLTTTTSRPTTLTTSIPITTATSRPTTTATSATSRATTTTTSTYATSRSTTITFATSRPTTKSTTSRPTTTATSSPTTTISRPTTTTTSRLTTTTSPTTTSRPTTTTSATTTSRPTTTTSPTTTSRPTTTTSPTTTSRPTTTTSATSSPTTTTSRPTTTTSPTTTSRPTTTTSPTTTSRPTTTTSATSSPTTTISRLTTTTSPTTTSRPTTTTSATSRPTTTMPSSATSRPTTTISTSATSRPTSTSATSRPTTTTSATSRPTTTISTSATSRPTTTISTSATSRPTTTISTSATSRPTTTISSSATSRPTTTISSSATSRPTTAISSSATSRPTTTISTSATSTSATSRPITTTLKIVPFYTTDVELVPALNLTWSLSSSQINRLTGSNLQTVLSSINASRSQPGTTYTPSMEKFRSFLIETLLRDPHSYIVTSEDIQGRPFHERADEGPTVVVKVLQPGFLGNTSKQTNSRHKRNSFLLRLKTRALKHSTNSLTPYSTGKCKRLLNWHHMILNGILQPERTKKDRSRSWINNIKLIDQHFTYVNFHPRAKTMTTQKNVFDFKVGEGRQRKRRSGNLTKDLLQPVLRFIWLLPKGTFPSNPGQTLDYIMKKFKQYPSAVSTFKPPSSDSTHNTNTPTLAVTSIPLEKLSLATDTTLHITGFTQGHTIHTTLQPSGQHHIENILDTPPDPTLRYTTHGSFENLHLPAVSSGWSMHNNGQIYRQIQQQPLLLLQSHIRNSSSTFSTQINLTTQSKPSISLPSTTLSKPLIYLPPTTLSKPSIYFPSSMPNKPSIVPPIAPRKPSIPLPHIAPRKKSISLQSTTPSKPSISLQSTTPSKPSISLQSTTLSKPPISLQSIIQNTPPSSLQSTISSKSSISLQSITSNKPSVSVKLTIPHLPTLLLPVTFLWPSLSLSATSDRPLLEYDEGLRNKVTASPAQETTLQMPLDRSVLGERTKGKDGSFSQSTTHLTSISGQEQSFVNSLANIFQYVLNLPDTNSTQDVLNISSNSIQHTSNLSIYPTQDVFNVVTHSTQDVFNKSANLTQDVLPVENYVTLSSAITSEGVMPVTASQRPLVSTYSKHQQVSKDTASLETVNISSSIWPSSSSSRLNSSELYSRNFDEHIFPPQNANLDQADKNKMANSDVQLPNSGPVKGSDQNYSRIQTSADPKNHQQYDGSRQTTMEAARQPDTDVLSAGIRSSSGQDFVQLGLEQPNYDVYWQLLSYLANLTIGNRPAQGDTTTATTSRPETTTPDVCPLGQLLECAPTRPSPRLVTFCQHRCDDRTGFCSSALCACFCRATDTQQTVETEDLSGTTFQSHATNVIESGQVFTRSSHIELTATPPALPTTLTTIRDFSSLSDETINKYLDFLAQRDSEHAGGNNNKEEEGER